MTEFNFRRAHREWAVPQYNKLSDQIKQLYRDVIAEYDGVNQLKNLDMPFLLTGFEERFANIAPDELGHAAYVIHCCGYWDDPKDENVASWPRDSHGAYWKFQRLANQTLCNRGYSEFIVPESNDEVPDKFMDHVDGSTYDNDEVAAILAPITLPEFIVRAVRDVNHKPDMFVIGSKHFPKDGSGYLRPEQAPCYRCGRPYAEHTHETVLFLSRVDKPDEDAVTEAEQAKLKEIVPELEKYKLDGFVFVSNK